MPIRIESTLAALAEIDPTLYLKPKLLPKLIHKRVYATSYSRRCLFSAMAKGKVVLFKDYPSPLTAAIKLGRHRGCDAGDLLTFLESLRDRRKYSVSCGRSKWIEKLDLPEILKRWNRGRAVMGITDLHIRETAIERAIDPDALSWFNLLCQGSEDVAIQEMMTAVLSTKNNITDSHSDDPDGSNHCFVGRKLWLLWDTFEGLARGLEDIERVEVTEYAKFDMDTFIGLRSSKWLLMEPGHTLFLPGHYTHKVITLENYVGVGSFYVSIPNCLRTLSRWTINEPLWDLKKSVSLRGELTAKIGKTAMVKVNELKKAPRSDRRQWGYDFLGLAADHWHRSYNRDQKASLLGTDALRPFVDVLG